MGQEVSNSVENKGRERRSEFKSREKNIRVEITLLFWAFGFERRRGVRGL